ncbi:MAG: ABC transporter ATP-binding protein [Rhodobacteraceae bacterium]|nr:ABC transporter ATP-binding protein [Paracoccaceae bacterium]
MGFWKRKTMAKTGQSGLDLTSQPYAVFEDVGLEMNQTEILQGVSLTLSEQRIGIVGLNGSGKSSLVRLLNGLRLPSTGSLKVFGQPVGAVRGQLPRHVGFVFQNPDHQAIFPTVEEEVAFGLTQLGNSKEDARVAARALLRRYGVEALADKPFTGLSEGQKQLVCILSVLVMDPEILILDEPMSSLDGLATRRIAALLRDLSQKLVMISHDLSLIDGFDRILWMEGGRLKMDGPPDAVLPAYERDINLKAQAAAADQASAGPL